MQNVTPVYTYQETEQDNEWLAMNSIEFHQKYRGEWIAAYQKKIIAHDQDFAKVAAVAEKMLINPLYAQFPEEEVVVYAWS